MSLIYDMREGGSPEADDTEGDSCIPLWKTDFILVTDDNPQIKEFEKKREKFLKLLNDDFTIGTVKAGEKVYIKLRCSFKRLCEEAEKVKLEMPLEKGKVCEPNKTCPSLSKWISEHFSTDNEDDYISAPFFEKQLKHFKGHANPDSFFRRSLRSLLTHHILINLNVCIENAEVEEPESKCCFCCKSTPNRKTTKSMSLNSSDADVTEDASVHTAKTESSVPPNGNTSSDENTKNDGKEENDGDEQPTSEEKNEKSDEDLKTRNEKMLEKIDSKRRGLRYFLLKNIFTDAFILHEEKEMLGEDSKNDLVHNMNTTWTVFYKFQPLWKVRNYFGEKIAFYFAWVGMLISSLCLPTMLGLAVFLYGLILSIEKSNDDFQSQVNGTDTQILVSRLSALLNVIRYSFDNDATPYFNMAICLWGTLFLEVWKRKSATLAYEWDVNDFQASEPDRPEFTGSKTKHDPVTDDDMWYYPLKKQLLRFAASFSAVIFMICLVLISLIGVIIYRVIIGVSQCPEINEAECLLLTTVVSSLLNAVSIVILGRFYNRLAVWLTDWENHQTQSKYDDALVIKIFAFQFVNSFASCFYIAFVIERVDIAAFVGLGTQYKDSCRGTCMSQLSFQVMVLMIVKPFPKFFMDIILPKIRLVWRALPCRKVSPNVHPETNYLEQERLKPKLNEFTLGEYTEKVIQYGFLMLFAASFPLAPLLAIVTNIIDLRVDANRLLNVYRRPIAFIAQDIGIWINILTFINFCGVLSNAFLVAFTSSWGQRYSLTGKFVIVILFEHIVFFLKYVLAYLIPDVPVDVQLAIRREKYQTALIFV